ncbi:VOC family protein [Paenibacillus sp. PR3]|uniref:VOC family protein n=1 Tax=Paenibacillus terricola TaxID=2763503 RepID=A0ABR8MTB6_9BACL|nr:VOC family protein [Paenibacillus terricola]MBD3917389.1 VOC family protein [Paenibacillus terricola]
MGNVEMKSTSVKESPIEGGVPAVFIYVSNLAKSVEWYGKLLGERIPDTIREDIHIFDLGSGACLFLRAQDYLDRINVDPSTWKPNRLPVCSLMAKDKDLPQAKHFLIDAQIEIIYEDDETINFLDPDGNVLMICSI